MYFREKTLDQKLWKNELKEIKTKEGPVKKPPY